MVTDTDESCKKGHHQAIFMGGSGFKKGFGGVMAAAGTLVARKKA